MRFLAAFLLLPCCWAISITTANYNNSRNNSNTSETVLTQANVATGGTFRKLCQYTVDERVYAQPLVVDGVSIQGRSRVVLLATMNNSLYLYDADNCSSQLWTVNFGTAYTTSEQDLYAGKVGILSTPVIDTATNIAYAVANINGTWKIFAVNLADGTTAITAVVIAGTVGTWTFSPTIQIQRTGLALANNQVYVCFGAYGDAAAYRGACMGYSATTLVQSSLWLVTPGDFNNTNCLTGASAGGCGGIWMSGGAPAIDGSGNLLLATGNGSWDGTTNFGQSLVKLSSALAVQDFFTPSNWDTLNTNDQDLGGARVILFSTFATVCGKDGRCWVLNQSALGQLQGSGPAIPQVWQTATTGFRAGGAFATDGSSTIFLAASSRSICGYVFSGSTFNTTGTCSASTYSYPGAVLFFTSNGATAGTQILWAITNSTSTNPGVVGVAGTLRAFNPSTMAEIYNSGATLGSVAKFAVPTAANGKIYVPTFDNNVAVFGLIPSSQIRGLATLRNGATIR